MDRKDIELMAPVGSYESLMAAIQGGADSVYFGVEHFNMRAASSNNFSLNDLNNIVAICRENGLKSYLTMNIVMYDREIQQMKQIIDTVAESGISAIIASDQAVINYAHSKKVNIHLSTQVNVSNIEALKYFSQWAEVVVLARELELSQVRYIYDTIRTQKIMGPSGDYVKIEMFAHGALCMAISGKCYLSLHENNTSANRGTCYQTCRKAYIVSEKENGNEIEIDNEYIMSSKDLCTIGFLNKLLDSGVRVLKIEGRARSAEYVKVVSSCYDEAIRAYCNGSYNDEKIIHWTNKLSTVFNRGFWNGYYLGQKLGEWSNNYGSSATKRKVYLGKITNYFTKLNVAEIKLENGDLKKGERIIILGPSTGVIEYDVEEIRVDLEKTENARKGDVCSIPIDFYLRRSDKVYKWIDSEEVLKQ
jgi:U32 family peptidase